LWNGREWEHEERCELEEWDCCRLVSGARIVGVREYVWDVLFTEKFFQ